MDIQAISGQGVHPNRIGSITLNASKIRESSGVAKHGLGFSALHESDFLLTSIIVVAIIMQWRIEWIHVCSSNGYTGMEKSAALRVRLPPGLHKEFLEVCKREDVAASHLLREFMRSYVERCRREQQTELFTGLENGDGQL